MSFDECMHPQNYHHNQDIEHFNYSQRFPHDPLQSAPSLHTHTITIDNLSLF